MDVYEAVTSRRAVRGDQPVGLSDRDTGDDRCGHDWPDRDQSRSLRCGFDFRFGTRHGRGDVVADTAESRW
jgi:hypothetical protein